MWTVMISTFLLTISAGGATAQDNKGTEFILTFPENLQRHQHDPTLFITTQSLTGATVTITLPSTGFTTTVTEVDVDRVAVELRGSVKSYKAIHVTSDVEIIIYGVFAEWASSDAYLALPTDVLGTEYFVPSATTNPGYPSEFAVVGVHDGTTVTITPTQSVTFEGNTYAAGDTFLVELERFGTLQVQSAQDLTGSKITANKPVTVLSGSMFAVVGNGQSGSGDYLVEMIPPVDTWGKEFVTAPLTIRTAGDLFRVVAARDNTQITVTNRNPRTLNAGEFWEFEAGSNEYLHVTSSEPVLLVQYSKTAAADGKTADPFLAVIPPVAQFEADYTFSTIDLINDNNAATTHHVNLVIKSADKAGLLFDGQPLPSNTDWHAVPGTTYEATDLTFSAGTHTASHASPIATFGLFSYGYTAYEAYGYPGGLRLGQISAPCSVTPMWQNDRVDNDCDGRVDEELLNGVDDDGDGLIDEDIASTCRDTDVVFVVDRSSSIGLSNFNLAKQYIVDTLQCFSDVGARVGVGYTMFDCVPETILNLGKYTSDDTALPGIIHYQMKFGGLSRISLAIRHMKSTSDFRDGSVRAAVILTDGYPQSDSNGQTTGDYVADADAARNAGIELYSVAIGRNGQVDDSALQAIAGSGANVFDSSDPCALASRILEALSCA
ncbi:FCGBP [Branchiostoma lanceolatum]|uniref:FCGBP protein n=1 Tax=Branchiostoma lanceolatum TaxID=7740 RepID=A0A8J9ZJS4_BRALA|nr:FCGBP [Branchiostoma lanceolatum]